MSSLQIVMLVCPLFSVTPNDCDVAVESPVVVYENRDACMARAQDIYKKSSSALYHAGLRLRVGCLDKKFFEGIKEKKGVSA
tara:strand:+ start:170 stop:415 length:246 start_codon:yes stop_codon:yes gene_type:complete